jgi:nucleoside-triphosphatase THEP1
MPVLILLVLYAVLGIISAIIGMRTGQKLADPSYTSGISYKAIGVDYSRQSPRVFDYSVGWLIVNFLLMIGCLLLANYLSFYVWAAIIIALVIVWAIRYKRALRQLVRPKFWIFFVFITMLTAIVFSRLESADYSTWDGIRIGIEMNLRAILLIMGFTVLGTELYNPRIRDYLQKGRFSQLTLAMELSFNTLPSVISDIPDLKTMIRRPGGVIYHLISKADGRLEEIRRKQKNPARIFIMTGDRDEGKTGNLRFTVYSLQCKMLSVGGIYSPKVMDEGKILGYDVVDVMTGERFSFLRKTGEEEDQKIGSYYILADGLEKGLRAIDKAIEAGVEVIVIDEVGRLELQGKGWASALRKVLAIKDINVYLAVRKDFVEEVVQEFGIEDYEIILPTP